MNHKFSIHHVGARAGDGPFPILPAFEPDFIITFYEADAKAVNQIRERNQHLKSEVRVLPYCLSDQTGKRTLRLNHDPYTSSLLEHNPRYGEYRSLWNYGAFGTVCDYALGEAAKTVEERSVDAFSLDDLRAKDTAFVAPDFLSIDTQGSEYAILTGASELLRDVVAVNCEVEFHPVYRDQKLFGDLYNLMASRGFLFVGFGGGGGRWNAGRSPISLRGEGIQLADDALFLREPETLSAPLLLYKLAFCAVLYNQPEIALRALKRAGTESPSRMLPAGVAPPNYVRFLEEFWETLRREPSYFPSTFASEFSVERSYARFEVADARGVRWLERIRDWCVRKPERYLFFKRILIFLTSNWRRLALVAKVPTAPSMLWRHPALQWRSPVERVLARYGFREQAAVLRRTRRRFAPFCPTRGEL